MLSSFTSARYTLKRVSTSKHLFLWTRTLIMKRNTGKKLLLGFLGVGLLATTLGSCRKKQDTIAVIHVMDSSNQAVAGAEVKLIFTATSGSGSPVRDPKVSTTDASGNATFNCNDIYQLGQCGVAVCDVQVTSGSDSGTGIIKVEQETTSEETVFL